jgi:hypothetical protein
MATTRTKFIPGLRLLFATLVLLFNSAAPAVKLMWPEKVTCGMACCLESGVCYCNSGSHSRLREESHGHSEGEESPDELDASRHVEIAAVTITSSCPAQCAQLPAGFQKKISMARARISECVLSINHARLLYACAPRFAREALLVASSAPRAPPRHSLAKPIHTFPVTTHQWFVHSACEAARGCA